MTLCQAKGCTNEPVPGDDLCGYHQELGEEREVIRKQPGRPLKEDTIEEKAALWDARRAKQREAKRKRAMDKAERRAKIHAVVLECRAKKQAAS